MGLYELVVFNAKIKQFVTLKYIPYVSKYRTTLWRRKWKKNLRVKEELQTVV
jgi:hypothetical protein